jgi:hypothetical protein
MSVSISLDHISSDSISDLRFNLFVRGSAALLIYKFFTFDFVLSKK